MTTTTTSDLEPNRRTLRRIIHESKPKQLQQLNTSPVLEHGWLLPHLLLADDFLWGRWNHWYETASAQRLVAPIPQIDWQRNEAGFKMLDRSLSSITKYGDWRGWGSWSAFDYFMDWLLFGFGYKGQMKLPDEKPEYERASGRLYQVFVLETLLAYPYDYLGEILAENRHGRHLGFFPTPMDVAALLAEMTFGGDDARAKTVCDPCVGTGRLLLAASNYSYRLYGSDINPTVIKATLVNGFLYAPWLVRPFQFFDSPVADQEQQLELMKGRRNEEPVSQPCLLLEI